MKEYITYLHKILPPFFPAPKLDELTNGILCWRSVQNRRARYPQSCFVKLSPKKTLIARDAFLDFLASQSPSLHP